MSTASAGKGNAKSGAERRRSERKPILETFSVFVSVPQKGPHRLRLHDLSDVGVGFDFDTEGEDQNVPLQVGDPLELHLYLNQSLYLPLHVHVRRIEDRDAVRRIGAEFKDRKSKSHKALVSFLQMLDSIADIAQIEPSAG